MLEGVDYSDARPGGTHLASQGKRFVVRYLYPNAAGTGKGLTTAEVHDLQGHGIAVACVYEGAAGDMRKGHAQGVADAKLAQTQLDGLPLDHALPVYFAKDYTGGLTAAEIAYLAGAASVLGADRVGLYGGWQAIDDAIRGKHAAWFWQTYAWSSGRVRAGIHLFQYSNGQWAGQVDYVRALTAEYGQHAPAVKPSPAPAPAPVPPPIAPPIPPHPTPAPPEEEPGMYIQAANETAIYWFNRASGTKRHVTPAEWAVAHLNETGGHVSVVTLPATDVAGIPNG